jgi:hypothetical protein
MKLKGVILSLENVVYHNNRLEPTAFNEMGRLVRFLLGIGIQPVIVANRTRWLAGKTQKLQDRIDQEWTPFPWFVAEEGTGGWKPRAEAVERVLQQMGWDAGEVAYVGNQVDDMKSAKNGGVLFLNAEWFTHSVDYGLKFGTMKEIARFVDLFCLRDHPWHFVVDEPDLQVYALSPYSTYKAEFAAFSEDARSSLKYGGRHVDFWTKYLCSSIYFSGIHRGVNYLAPYPGHSAGAGSPILNDLLLQVATCFGVAFLRDLIVRHSDAPKSSQNRSTSDHFRQLNTIHLNRTPLKSLGEARYKNSPLAAGNKVLVVDDFCTEGYALDSARNYIKQTGAQAVGVAFLKTINTDYRQLVDLPLFNPYVPNTFAQGVERQRPWGYHTHIIDPAAPAELGAALSAFDGWDWPIGI